jgi:membrane protein YqaA with SNARE-associated domain
MTSLYHRLVSYAHTPLAFTIYAVVAFTESFIFPLPPDLLMIPMILSDRSRAFRLAFYGTLFSVLGGMIGYGIGYGFSKTCGAWIINTYGLAQKAQTFYDGFAKWGFWIIVLKGLTPIPFKLVTIASGVAHFPLIPFIFASILARAFRFYLLAFLLWMFGPTIKPFIEKNLPLVFLGILGIIVIGVIVVFLI